PRSPGPVQIRASRSRTGRRQAASGCSAVAGAVTARTKRPASRIAAAASGRTRLRIWKTCICPFQTWSSQSAPAAFRASARASASGRSTSSPPTWMRTGGTSAHAQVSRASRGSSNPAGPTTRRATRRADTALMYGSRARRCARRESSQVRSTHGENSTIPAGRGSPSPQLSPARDAARRAPRVAREDDARRGNAAREAPPVRGDGVLQRRRERVLGGEAVAGDQDGQPGVEGEPRRDGPVGARGAHHVPAAVQIQDRATGRPRGGGASVVAGDDPLAGDGTPGKRLLIDRPVSDKSFPSLLRSGPPSPLDGNAAGRLAT